MKAATITSFLIVAAYAAAQTQQGAVKEEHANNAQIEIAGSGVATLDIGRDGLFGGRGLGSRSQINYSDSSLSLGAAQRLYRNGIGSFAIGGLTTDESNSGRGKQFFLHQAFLDYQDLRFEAYLGRTNSPSAQFLEFPTIREDDLLDYTTVTNPFSDGGNLEEHRYSNVASATFNSGLKHFVNVHAQHQIDSAKVGDTDDGLNTFGVTYQYEGNPSLSSIDRFPSYGIGFGRRSLSSAAGGASSVVYGGGVMNLHPSITNRFDLRLLAQTTFGNDTKTLGSLNDTYRADHTAVALSLRNLNSPFGKPASQWALTAGYKSYSKVSDASSYGVAVSYVKSLGQGFDLVSQFGYERRSDGLAAAFGGRKDAAVFQIGLVFNFGTTFNQSIGPRRSPTNLLHKYIPD